MFKKKIIEIGEEMTKFWHLEKMCRYKNSEKLIVAHVIRVRSAWQNLKRQLKVMNAVSCCTEKLIVAHVIRVRSAWQKPKKLNHRAMIIKQLRVYSFLVISKVYF